MKDRLELAGIGAVAGLCLWALFEHLPNIVGEGFLLLALTVAASVFFSVLMALVGPERPQRALLPSLALGAVAGCLALWVGLRFETVSGFFGAAHPLMALFVLVLVAAPFAAAALEEKDGWRHYARLFDSAWGIFIRYVAGWLFAGLIYLVLLLSDELLKLVGIRIIDELLRIDAVRFTVIGAVFGLGVATVHELRDYVSPVLVHRLLRMLLPLVLLVVIVFIGALPFRGLSGLFGELSTGGVLMAVAFAGITLITTAIDRDNENASQMKLMTVSARIMALLLPVLVGLAVYALWLRVSAYGWTPQRLIAGYIALFLAGYVASYLWAILERERWQERLRQSNLYMALAVCGGAVLWLTPLVHVEAIATGSQVKRYLSSDVALEDMPFYEMAHDWGRVGLAGLDKIEAQAADDAPVRRQIAAAREASSRWAYERGNTRETDEELRVALLSRIKGLPEGADIAPILAQMESYVLRNLQGQCPERETPECVIVLLGGAEDKRFGSEAIFLARQFNTVSNITRQGDSKYYLRTAIAYDSNGEARPRRDDLFDKVMAGEFRLEPITRNFLSVGDQVIIPYN